MPVILPNPSPLIVKVQAASAATGAPQSTPTPDQQPAYASQVPTQPGQTNNVSTSRPTRSTAKYQTQKVLRRKRLAGQLRSLSHASDPVHDYLNGARSIANAIVVNIPSMPDTIDLVRSARYKVTSHFAAPDGIHLYQGTDPLEIPFSFELHAFDEEYCDQGAMSLLQIGAWLHALALPIDVRNRAAISARTLGASANENGADNSDSGIDKRSNETQVSLNIDQNSPLPTFPVACKLDLIYTGDRSPGISCVGYVKEVKVTLKGPWLNTPNPLHHGLPSSAEYSFTFVHRPGHTNNFLTSEFSAGNFDLGVQLNAYADNIKNEFYNTISVTSQAENLSFKGFST